MNVLAMFLAIYQIQIEVRDQFPVPIFIIIDTLSLDKFSIPDFLYFSRY